MFQTYASTAPEIFQKCMDRILNVISGCLVHMDDILIFGSDQNDHEKFKKCTCGNQKFRPKIEQGLKSTSQV